MLNEFDIINTNGSLYEPILGRFFSPELFSEAGLPEEMRSALASAYKDVVMKYRLFIKGSESEFRIVPTNEKQEITFMGQVIDVNAAAQLQANYYTYKNHYEGIVLDKTQAFGKDFILKDSILNADFQIVEAETKDILGYECIKAVSLDGKNTVWYTPNIPIKDEPIACGLKGLILQMDNGQQIYTAIEIIDKNEKEIIRPTGESVISKEEFENQIKKRIEMMKRN